LGTTTKSRRVLELVKTRIPPPVIAAVLAFVTAGVLLVPRVCVDPLRHWDEAWYAQVSRETLRSGQWLTLFWNGEPWFDKPPLCFWVTSAAFRVLGESETSARLFSSLCGAGLAAILAAFVAARSSASVGFLAALILMSIPDFARYAGRGQLDGPLALFVFINVLCYWRGLKDPNWHFLSGMALGCAIMAKGAGAALGPMIQMGYALFSRDFGCFRQLKWYGGTALGIAMALPWHVVEWVLYPDQFPKHYADHHFSRLFSNIFPGNVSAAPPWDYYVQYLIRAEPWGWLMLAMGGVSLLTLILDSHRWRRLLAVWILIVPVALSCSRGKWSWYLVPVYPAVALLAVEGIMLGMRFPATRRLIPVTTAVFGMLAMGVACEPWILPTKEGEAEIREIAPFVRQRIPDRGGLHTLQLDKVRHSVYPIATRFYVDRPTYALHSWEELQRVMTGPKRDLFVLARSHLADEIKNRTRHQCRVETLGRSGTITLFLLRGLEEARIEKRFAEGDQAIQLR
jgi:4-amino-4-deoxy-L-arabinose transferase-like glycosyltransferase